MRQRLWITLVWSLWLAIALAVGLPDLGRASEPLRRVSDPPRRVSEPVQAIEFYFFINGDNDLISTDTRGGNPIHQGEKSFEELSRVALAAGRGTAFHLYYDPNSEVSGNRISQTTVRRYRDGELQSENTYGETDSGEVASVRLLLSERFFPHAYRAIAFWSHGEGWEDIGSFDFSAPEKAFNYLDLAPGLEGHGFDLVIFDACRMAYLETLSAYQGKSSFLMASQFDLPVGGTEFGNLARHLSDLRAGPRKKGYAPREFTIELHRRLNADTVAGQRPLGVFAPLALFELVGLRSFRDRLATLLADVAARFHGSDWSALAGRSSETRAVDLRGLIARLRSKFEYDASSMIDAFGAIAPGKYGSILFYLPEEFGRIPDSSLKDELEIQSRKPWSEGLPNWDLVRAWLR